MSAHTPTARRLAGSAVLAGALVVTAAAWTPAGAHPAGRPASHPAAHPASRGLSPAFTPSISVSPTSGGPGSQVRIKGTGYKPSDTVYFYFGTVYSCGITPNASGVIAATACTVPSVPHGSQTLSGQQDSNTITATTPFTVTSRITYLNYAAVSPGAVLTVSAGGLAGSSALTAKVDSTTATTNPPAISSDSGGSVNSLQVTVPAGTTTGTHTLSITDGAGNSATTTLTVYKPTLTVSPATAAPGTPLAVSGSGYKPSNTIYLYEGTTYVCGFAVSSTGSFNTSCNAPSAPYGSSVFSAQQTSTLVSATQAGGITPGVTYLSSDAVSRGGTIYINAAGFSPSSALAATISGVSGNLVTNPVSVSSDSNGSTGGLYITMPTSTSLAAGSHTLSITDANGHSATTALTVYVPTLTIASSGYPGQQISVSGSKFRPGDSVAFYLGTSYFGGATPDSTGSFALIATVPAAPVGAATVYAYQESGNAIVVSKAFTVKPGVSYQSVQYIAPGSSVTVNVGGLDPSVGFTTTVGKTVVTTSGPTATDANGSLNSLVIPIPAGTKAGSTTITVKDKAPSKPQSVKVVVQVYTPTISISPTSGVAPGSVVHITGAGWRPDDNVYPYLTGTTTGYSTYLCGFRTDGSGAFNAYCTISGVPADTYTVKGQQDGSNITAPGGSLTIVPSVYNLSSTVVSGRGSEQLYAQGLAQSSAVTVKLDGTALTVKSGTPTTDTNGNVGYLTVALPTTLSAGSHTLTVSDAAGNVATATLTALTPTLTLSDTSVAAGSSFAVNGSGFDGSQSLYFYLDGTYFCGVGTDPAGNVSSSCTIPAGTAAGSHTLSAQQDSDGVEVDTTLTTS